MENKNNCAKVGFSKVLWSVIAILMCAVPCAAVVEVPAVEEWDIPGDIGPTINDTVWVYGTLNMYSGAYVVWDICAYPGAEADAPGGTVNVYGCALGNILWVFEPSTIWPGLPPVVTVYGPKFKIGTQEQLPPADMQISGLLEVLSETDAPLFSLTIYSGIVDIRLRAPDGGGPEEVTIDIKPGSYPNSINLGSHGVIPVAILSDADFDATSVDPKTVFLAGAGVRVRGKGNKYLASQEDVNGDGLIDLVVKVETENLNEGEFQGGGAYLRVHETSDKTSLVLI